MALIDCSGKTTLARQILGLARPQQGRVSVLGRSPAGRGGSRLRRRMAVVPQDPDLRVCRPELREELALDAELRGRSRTAAYAWAAQMLSSIGLAAWGEEHPLRLSGGQRRLAYAAAACYLGAEFILADEPTAGLSAGQGEGVYRALLACARAGAAVLVISHQHEGLRAVADRVVRMEAGRVTQVEWLREPRAAAVRDTAASAAASPPGPARQTVVATT